MSRMLKLCSGTLVGQGLSPLLPVAHKDFGYRTNVRSAIKRIQGKFRAFAPTLDKIENYANFGYRWEKPA
jgi:hypothetical protein